MPGSHRPEYGFIIGLCILVMPYLFSWFTLEKGYSVRARVLSLGWCSLFLLPVLSLIIGIDLYSNTEADLSDSTIKMSRSIRETVIINKLHSARNALNQKKWSEGEKLLSLAKEALDRAGRVSAESNKFFQPEINNLESQHSKEINKARQERIKREAKERKQQEEASMRGGIETHQNTNNPSAFSNFCTGRSFNSSLIYLTQGVLVGWCVTLSGEEPVFDAPRYDAPRYEGDIHEGDSMALPKGLTVYVSKVHANAGERGAWYRIVYLHNGNQTGGWVNPNDYPQKP